MTRASRRSTLNPYTTQRLAEEHHLDLLRSAEAWRLAHPVQIQATKNIAQSAASSSPEHFDPQPDSLGSSLMTIKRTSPGIGWPGGFPFSLAGEAYGLCFISGMPALDPDGKFVPGTFEEETELAWHNVAAIAEASGCSVDDIVYVQCVLSDIDNYGDLNAWWRRLFPDISTAPARFTFQASALPFGAKIEIQAIAARSMAVKPVGRGGFCGT
jgi:2-iminobutanoate/2-iminopropanoate deaminase